MSRKLLGWSLGIVVTVSSIATIVALAATNQHNDVWEGRATIVLVAGWLISLMIYLAINN